MIKYEGDFVVLEFDLPDYERDDISIDVNDHGVSIEAERKDEKKVDEGGFKSTETSSSSFSYSSSLPSVVFEKADIDLNEGRLKIKIPKK